MTTRKKILIAVAAGCHNTRQIAEYISRPLGTINMYLHNPYVTFGFVNGDLLQWQPGKANTLRPGPCLAIIRDGKGNVKDVGRVEVIT